MMSHNYPNQGHSKSTTPAGQRVPVTTPAFSNAKNPKNPMPTTQTRVLLVDDDPRILELLAAYMRYEGYRIETASNGEEALKILDEFSPDVMCIDLMMPKMDGQELARRIRARQDLLYVPIVMLTAIGSQDAAKVASLNSGVDAYLAKPVKREELAATIRTMLRIKSAQDKMLEALDRVADVQDELLEYERQQGQYEAMRATISMVTNELNRPLYLVDNSTNRLEKLIQAGESGQYDPAKIAAASRACVQEIRDALAQVNTAMQRLTEINQTIARPSTNSGLNHEFE